MIHTGAGLRRPREPRPEERRRGPPVAFAGIAAALQNETSVIVQVRAEDEVCVEATLTNVKKANAEQFKAKTQ